MCRPINMSGKQPDNHRLRCPEKVDHCSQKYRRRVYFVGAELAREAVDAVCQIYRVIVLREQARLPQNLRNSRVGRADIEACAKSSV